MAGSLIFSSAGQIDAIVPVGTSTDKVEVQVQYQGQMSAAVSHRPCTGHDRYLLRGLFRHRPGERPESGRYSQFGGQPRRGRLGGHALGDRRGPTFAEWGRERFCYCSPLAAGGSPGDERRSVKQPAEVLYAGSATGLVDGVIQVNLRVPAATQTGAAVPVLLHVGNSTSQSGLTLAIKTQ